MSVDVEAQPLDATVVLAGGWDDFPDEDAAKLAATSDEELSAGADSVRQYLNEIGRTPLLDAADEVRLAKRIEAGQHAGMVLRLGDPEERPGAVALLDELHRRAPSKRGHLTFDERAILEVSAEQYATARRGRALLEVIRDEGEAAKDLFIRANLRLVVSLAKRYVKANMPMLDLIQEGNSGLIRAVEKFDYERGYKFSTYATWWIRQAITRAIHNQADLIRKPVHVAEEVNVLRRAQRGFYAKYGFEPNNEELALATGYDEERIEWLIAHMADTVSYDVEVGPDQGTIDASTLLNHIGDDAPGPEETVLAGMERDSIHALLNHLGDRDAAIMRARYGLDDGREHTLTEVATRFSLSRERIRQIEIQCLGRLRELARAEGLRPAA
jgi:RNA polymerase sigma factor (sigma-70 family)